MTMRVKVTFTPKGEVITEVQERGEHQCSEVLKVTNAVGHQMNDEQTGPECDRVEEINN
jgi:hypothetical protein